MGKRLQHEEEILTRQSKLSKHEWVDKKRFTDRARKIEGQAAGVARMIQSDRHCAEILQQITALNSAAQELAVLLMEDHVEARCNEGINGEGVAEELTTLLRRALKL